MKLTSNQIQEINPHRYPFALVDRIDDYQPGEYAKGIKCISVNEAQFCGHFPQHHVMPGVLLVEALAQVGCIAILTKEENKGKLVFFAGINGCRFKGQVIPGDVVELSCTLIKQKGPIGIGEAIAKVDGKTVVKAELMFAIQ
ncbi:3-hydroxyacyl-ACP dehydratase FabZ [Tannockella kyphosi]|uniref:3-hydroxyacyl-ACP dehydratase FabZ n=1 Tax=Tannockella kyphosi TaxID=2899121 RepID=UPI00201309F4|nr:3-hydroxyacyl-ACP dehydratase FabZ [Tannockella kyphosi]